MTHIRCDTIKWLSRRSIGQLIIIFASPSLPLVMLMSTIDCSTKDGVGVGVVCSLAEMGLMLCGAAIGILVAFEIYRERNRKHGGHGGHGGWPNEPRQPTPKGGCKAGDTGKKSSPDVVRNSKNATRIKELRVGTVIFAAATLIALATMPMSDTDVSCAQSNQESNQVMAGDLFIAAATILGFAVFGSALTTLGRNKDLIVSTAFALIAFGVVQTAFMLSLVSAHSIPTTWWVGMTGAWLFWVVLMMAVSKSLSE